MLETVKVDRQPSKTIGGSTAALADWFATSPFVRAVLFLAALAFADLIYFRVPIFNGFSHVWSDHFDGGIEAALYEHWYNVVRGYANWSEPNYFYPVQRSLGYNEGFFLFGLIHSMFRAAGFDIFVAAQLMNMVVKSIGFAGFYLFLRSAFDARFGYALLGAVIFTIGHGLFMHAFHQQLEAVCFAPLVAYLMVRARNELAELKPARFALFAGCGAVLYSAWCLTGYYMAWFFALFSSLALLLGLFVGGLPSYRQTVALLLRFKWHSFAVILVFGLSLAPFLMVYLPKAAETGMHVWAEALAFSPAPNDILNVGTGNFIFGRLFHRFCADCTVLNYEDLSGIPPILAYLFVCGFVWLMARRREAGAVMLRAMAIAAVLTWLMVMHFDDWSGWHLIFDWVPGARGVRVLGRYQLFLTFPVVAVAVMYVQSVAGRQSPGRMPRTIVALLATVMMLEQLGTSPAVGDRADTLARIAAPRPPVACKAFFTTKAKGQDASSALMTRFPHNVEAMLIAELVQLPTINGYATFLPPGWAFEDPTAPDYLARIRAYAQRYDVQGLCQLNLETLTWSGPIT